MNQFWKKQVEKAGFETLFIFAIQRKQKEEKSTKKDLGKFPEARNQLDVGN